MSSSIAAAASFASAMLPFWVGVSTARTLVRTMLRDNAGTLRKCSGIVERGVVRERGAG
jgi:hypothetical protein